MELEQMKEIAGTGFFFTRDPSGEILFARDMGEMPMELDPEAFAEEFGMAVESPEARQEAQSVLDELNRTRQMNLMLADFGGVMEDQMMDQDQDMMAGAQGMLGQMMGY